MTAAKNKKASNCSRGALIEIGTVAFMADCNNNSDRTARCFDRGLRAMQVEQDYEYAHLFFSECFCREPSNDAYASAMLQNLRLRAVRKSQFILRSVIANSRLRRIVGNKDWKSAFGEGIRLLQKNPWDAEVLLCMAKACAALHHNESELVYLKGALDCRPKSAIVNRRCAQSLGRMGQFDQAIACWLRVSRLKQGDNEAAEMISRLSEEKLKYPNGRPPVHQPAEHSPESVQLSAVAGDSSFTGALGRRGLNLLPRSGPNAQRSVPSTEADSPFNKSKPKIEILLLLGIALLYLQLYPEVCAIAWRALDFREWSRATWLLINGAVISMLVAVRSNDNLPEAIRRTLKRVGSLL
jgi:tetratricopeptide (TPR) repeat protein